LILEFRAVADPAAARQRLFWSRKSRIVAARRLINAKK